MLVLAVLAFPMTFSPTEAWTRFVLVRALPVITEVVEEHFGVGAGKLITLLYFFAIFPILLVYSVALDQYPGQLHGTPIADHPTTTGGVVAGAGFSA